MRPPPAARRSALPCAASSPTGCAYVQAPTPAASACPRPIRHRSRTQTESGIPRTTSGSTPRRTALWRRSRTGSSGTSPSPARSDRDRPKPGGEQLQDGTSAPVTNFSRQPESAVEVVGRRGAIDARCTFTPKFWMISPVLAEHGANLTGSARRRSDNIARSSASPESVKNSRGRRPLMFRRMRPRSSSLFSTPNHNLGLSRLRATAPGLQVALSRHTPSVNPMVGPFCGFVMAGDISSCLPFSQRTLPRLQNRAAGSTWLRDGCHW
ncbi:MAG: hypothetical protein JWQ55_4037 [Rhodopila sp.]|nr:hypothetical protein [Rhodopila sp.]